MLAGLTGLIIGLAGAWAIHAQQTKTPPGYVVAEVEVTDRPTMQKYGAQVPDTLAPYGGHFLARSGKTHSLEGDQPKGIVIIAFDSVEKAQAWYDSPAYAAIRPLRQSAAKSRIFIVEGAPPQ